MTVRYYSSVAAETTLSVTINNSATSVQIGSAVGLPALVPFTMAIDYEGASEELVNVTNVAGTTLTVDRGIDGTSATSHNAGARVRHVSSARDFSDSRSHENSTTNVHGVTGEFVDTDSPQILSNKTLDDATGSLDNITINNSAGNATRLNGLAGDPTDRFVIHSDPAAVNPMFQVLGNGGVFIRNRDATDDADLNFSRIRVLKSDGATNIFVVDGGGQAQVFPEGAKYGVRVVPKDTTDTVAYSVRDVANTVDNFAVWRNGRVDINGSDPAVSQFDITGAPAQSAQFMRVMASGGDERFVITSTGSAVALNTASIRNESAVSSASEVVFKVFARPAGQTARLTEWYNTAGTAVASVDANGFADFVPDATTTAASVFTASAGWSVISAGYARTASVVSITVLLQRTGADIVAPATGNIAESTLGTIAAAIRANTVLGASGIGGSTSGMGYVSIDSGTGTCTLTTWSPSSTISTGAQLRLTATYVTD